MAAAKGNYKLFSSLLKGVLFRERKSMRVILGMILGAFLTVIGAYSYDVVTGKMVATPDVSANVPADNRPMVNWDIVGRNWQHLESNVREMATRVHEQWTKRSS
jgi:hypothetical protein